MPWSLLLKKKKKSKTIFCWKTGSQFTPKFLEGLCDWKTPNEYPKWELLIQQTMMLDKNTSYHSRYKMICMRPNQSLFPEAPVHCTKRYKMLMVAAPVPSVHLPYLSLMTSWSFVSPSTNSKHFYQIALLVELPFLLSYTSSSHCSIRLKCSCPSRPPALRYGTIAFSSLPSAHIC